MLAPSLSKEPNPYSIMVPVIVILVHIPSLCLWITQHWPWPFLSLSINFCLHVFIFVRAKLKCFWSMPHMHEIYFFSGQNYDVNQLWSYLIHDLGIYFVGKHRVKHQRVVRNSDWSCEQQKQSRRASTIDLNSRKKINDKEN